MRLGRSVAALGATAALAASGAFLAGPAAAEVTSETSDFTLDVPFQIDPDAETVTVSGKGCKPVDGKPSTVIAVLASQTDDGKLKQKPAATETSADGTWSVAVPVKAAIAEDGASPIDGTWAIHAACLNYANTQVDSLAHPVLLDATSVDGTTFTISGQTAGQQTIEVNGVGWTEGKEVTITLNKADGDSVAELGKAAPAADGTFTFSTTLPKVPDGTYELNMVDSRGEGGTSVDLIKVDNGVYSIINRGGNGGIDDDDDNNSTASASPSAVAVPAANPQTTSKPAASGRNELARTGANTMAAIVVAGGLVAGGVVLASRRRKA